MNTQPFGIYWPDRASGQISVLGRPLLAYELPNTGVLDPDTIGSRAGCWRTPCLGHCGRGFSLRLTFLLSSSAR
jgi:hypothetical protein